ncbi:DNA polymerase III [Treponema parvum]|uniref:DNA polymerase III n=1 Tax=Treponema parvum TaxID=138851 RepID=UPI001AEC1B55|nr:DNA polymerase III [Treponema parvum]QTQ16108.1 DNA polymerase III [Treponema parvum]
MFDNILFQSVVSELKCAVLDNNLPGANLFSGPSSSGKLTCALETARVLSCRSEKRGEWNCTCASCVRHRSLTASDILLTGPRDCCLEISAAKKTFLDAVNSNAKFIRAAHYLFIRSIRKLTLRFDPVLWDGDDKISKIAVLTSSINEGLEEIDVSRTLPPEKELVKICSDLEKQCAKLEDEFMYDSIPVLHVRNASSWAHLPSNSGKKIIIIENADRMLEGVRNALLKILEEPPADTVFILTTTRRSAVMPTILSRVRTYSFNERTLEQQAEVISRIFHSPQHVSADDSVHSDRLSSASSGSSSSVRPCASPSYSAGGAGIGSVCGIGGVSIEQFLYEFLPVPPASIKESAKTFMKAVSRSKIPDVQAVCKACGNFSLKTVLKMFLRQCLNFTRPLFKSAAGSEAAKEISESLHKCMNNVLSYNQSPQGALEQLVRELLKITAVRPGILPCMDL